MKGGTETDQNGFKDTDEAVREKRGGFGGFFSIQFSFSSSGNVAVIYCCLLISQRGGREMSF